MNKLIVFTLIAFLFIGAAVVAIYFLYEKPVQEKEPEYYNVSIRTYEDTTGRQVASGYVIVLDDSSILYANGTTLNQGYVLAKVPKNHTFVVFNSNIANQSYYTLRGFYGSSMLPVDSFRVDFPLTSQGTVAISHDGILGIDSVIHVTLDVTGEFRYPSICLQWSSKIISVTIPDKDEMLTLPKRLEGKVVKCYSLKSTLKDDHVIIPIQYIKYGTLDESDFIQIYVLDGDIRYYSINPLDGYKSYILEDTQGNDVGQKDYLYVVK